MVTGFMNGIKSLLYKEKFAKIFKDCMQYPEPENKDLLKNVY